MIARLFSLSSSDSGEDDSGCDFVALGGNGVISVTANVAPKLMHE